MDSCRVLSADESGRSVPKIPLKKLGYNRSSSANTATQGRTNRTQYEKGNLMNELLSPTNDYVFKRLFGESPDLLLHLINDLRYDLPPYHLT